MDLVCTCPPYTLSIDSVHASIDGNRMSTRSNQLMFKLFISINYFCLTQKSADFFKGR